MGRTVADVGGSSAHGQALGRRGYAAFASDREALVLPLSRRGGLTSRNCRRGAGHTGVRLWDWEVEQVMIRA